WALRAAHGDDLVQHLGVEVLPPAALFEAEADVLIPGARIGVIDPARAEKIRARVIAPAANVPYVAGAVEVLRRRGITALPDVICNAGAVLGYVSTEATTHREVLDIVERRIGALIRRAMDHPEGPLAGGSAIAEAFLRTWREPSGMPSGPPLG